MRFLTHIATDYGKPPRLIIKIQIDVSNLINCQHDYCISTLWFLVAISRKNVRVSMSPRYFRLLGLQNPNQPTGKSPRLSRRPNNLPGFHSLKAYPIVASLKIG